MNAAVATDEWLARWRDAASQCWARPGVCCRRGCRVEALAPPETTENTTTDTSDQEAA